MFNSSNGYSLADIAAATNGEGRNDNMWGGNSAWWIIVLFLFAFNGGWGNGGYGAGGMQGALTRSDLCAEMNFNGLDNAVRGIQNGICSLGYDQLAQMNGISSAIASGFSGVDNAICTLGYQTQQGFNDLGLAVLNSQNAQTIAAMQNQNALQAQIANCCCENREAIAGLKYQMATDTCALTTAGANNTRDIIDNQNTNTRAILDFLTQDKIATLTAENQSLKFQASQVAQNEYLVNQLKPCPVAAYTVPAPFPINTYSCGCGLNYAA